MNDSEDDTTQAGNLFRPLPGRRRLVQRIRAMLFGPKLP